jgi:putative Holliday junction resolvase
VIVLVDERFTSRLAEESLLKSGMRRRRRRETVDKVAAAIILQDYLDRQR